MSSGLVNSGEGVIGYLAHAPVAQLAEATDSKPVQCEFESHLGHHF